MVHKNIPRATTSALSIASKNNLSLVRRIGKEEKMLNFLKEKCWKF
jgi:hypothetical protein